MAAVSGDVTDPAVLIQAHIANAAMLVAACPDPLVIRQMIETAKMLNPNIEVVLRSHSEEESLLFEKEGGTVFFAEEQNWPMAWRSMSWHDFLLIPTMPTDKVEKMRLKQLKYRFCFG